MTLFTPEHAMLRKSVRAFVEKEVAPYVDEWEAAGQIPKAFWRRLGRARVPRARVPGGVRRGGR